MSSTRSFLFAAFAFVAFLLWQAWQQDYAPKPMLSEVVPTAPVAGAATEDKPVVPAGNVPSPPPAAGVPSAAPAASTDPAAPAKLIKVHTDLLDLAISTNGGSVVRADLLAYPIDPSDKTKPVRLLDDAAATFFAAQSGLLSRSGPAPDHSTAFAAEADEYTLAAGSDKIEVPLTWRDPGGLQVKKVYIFTRGSYLIQTRVEVTNNGTAPWTGSEYRQLRRVPPVVSGGGFSFNNPEKYAFAGAAWYSPQNKFQKLAFDKFETDKLCAMAIPEKMDLAKCSYDGGWVAMLQHYFFAAWIPAATEKASYQYKVIPGANGPTNYLISAVSPAFTVGPAQTQTISTHLYIGPTLQSQLDTIEQANIAHGLGLTADYGTLTFIAEPFHWILVQLYGLVGNWGLAIILLVVLIKIVMFKLSESQFRSMAKMRRLQPRMEALKERYGDDRQKLSAATMELYQKEKINPLGGCLPTLIQIPVFFALYYVLLESVELRQAPFFGWIHNLSAPDPLFILPVLNAAIMGATTWLSPTSPGMDPMQARMMKMMPLMFAVLFLFFPAGLVLYYTVNGGLSLLQQWIINRRMQAADKPN
jgi:YidC/Oxa1 family membrane protein insertase